MRWTLFSLALFLASRAPVQSAEPSRGLDIWFIDTEGGAATLIVTPAGESVLIDCGNPGARDAERIHAVATKQAGLKQIDHLAITHWHSDHYGGASRLARLMPIANCYDRGIPESLDEDKKNFPLLIQGWREASKGKSKTLKPGDVLPLKKSNGGQELKLLVLCANQEVIPEKPGAAANPIAGDHKPRPKDTSDNANSLGFLLQYGNFRFLDLGDLTWNIEHKLVSPSDRIGKVDVYQVTHHGLNISNNPVVIRTVEPRVAIFNNGARKGGHTDVMAELRRVPGIRGIYQMHRNLTVGASENAEPDFIANAEEKCQGESIKLAVAADGKAYAVTVGSKGKAKEYQTREVDK